MDAAGSVAIITDQYNHLIRRVNLNNAAVTTIAGVTFGDVGINNFGSANGIGTAASFYFPVGVTMNGAGTFAIIADRNNHLLRRLNVASGVVATVAGDPTLLHGFANGVGTFSSFYYPAGASMNAAGTFAIIVRRVCKYLPGANAMRVGTRRLPDGGMFVT